MPSVTINVFRFADLPADVQTKVVKEWLSRNREFYAEMGSDVVGEDFKQQLAGLGYPTDNIEWSLGYCQGDGMAFYGSIDGPSRATIAARVLGRALTAEEAVWLADATIEICRNSFGHHYSHWNTMQVNAQHYQRYDFDDATNRRLDNFLRELDERIGDEVKEVSRRLEAFGYKVFEGYDEAYAKEDIEAGEDLWFTAAGEKWDGPDPEPEAAPAEPKPLRKFKTQVVATYTRPITLVVEAEDEAGAAAEVDALCGATGMDPAYLASYDEFIADESEEEAEFQGLADWPPQFEEVKEEEDEQTATENP